jgi:outer membrane lipoprotein-sorting protein
MTMKSKKNRIRPLPVPRQYTSEIIRSDGDHIKVYMDLNRRRSEQTVGDMTRITIWRSDLGVMYGIDCNCRTYQKYRITPDMEAVVTTDVEDDVEWELVTTEPLGPHTVDVYDIYPKGKKLRRARIWVDNKTHIRWKEVTYNEFGDEVLTIEARNVEVGPPPDSVFELPPGLQEMVLGKRKKR